MNRIPLLILYAIGLILLLGCTPSAPEPAAAGDQPQNQANQLTLLPTIINNTDEEQHNLDVGIFYYPWYQTPETDGGWWHWDGFGNAAYAPPANVQSDYYPLLGAYSSFDPAVVDQHFSWIASAGIEVVISSWWGIGSPEDAAVPLLLETAALHDLKIAFHIEPYTGRTADSLIEDVAYINQTYGGHSAFYRTNKSSRWNSSTANKGLFFVWLLQSPDFESAPVDPSYWQQAIDAIHHSPSGGMVIGNATDPHWLEEGHFDGLYNYATVAPADDTTFAWSHTLPINSLYVPSVLPGFVGERSNIDITLPRNNGQSYQDQWSAASSTLVKPFMLTITSFNEWHEGSSIEPAAESVPAGTEGMYKTFGPIGEMGYLTLTSELADELSSAHWPSPAHIRLHLSTTSDWTTFTLVSGGRLIRPTVESVSDQAGLSPTEDGRQLLTQSLESSQQDNVAETIIEFYLVNAEEFVTFEIERGGAGTTTATVWALRESNQPTLLETVTWNGVSDGERNKFQFEVAASPFQE